MKKTAVYLFVFALLLGLAAPGQALELKNAQAGYSLQLPSGWSTMDKSQIHDMFQGISSIVAAEQHQAIVIANTQGAIDKISGPAKLCVLAMPIPFNALGVDQEAAKEIKAELANNPQQLIDDTEVELKNNPLYKNYKLYSKQNYADGYMLEYRVNINGSTLHQTVATRFSKDYLVVLIGQYIGANNPSYNKLLLKALNSFKVAPAHKF